MAKADVLLQVVDDEECNKLLVDALRAELKKGPVKFYKNFVEPRSGKMKEPVEGVVRLTVDMEVARMNETTAPEQANDKNKAND